MGSDNCFRFGDESSVAEREMIMGKTAGRLLML